MKFHIERASGAEPPYEGAVLVDNSTGKVITEENPSDYYFPPRRRKNKSHYEIEIRSFEELVKLASLDEHGIIIDTFYTPIPRITIYDDYIE